MEVAPFECRMNLAGLYIQIEAKKRRIKIITVEIVPKRARRLVERLLLRQIVIPSKARDLGSCLHDHYW